ncbi:class I SAM-dependent methyltransferase [Dactylosporangium sp. NPDC048998]|uniref:class I SAM-dependent methyltransferase n=1 Tax=Dactylosporangium sp. NPDC048998 TaxID=3363976 RepID=UPI00372196D8
MGDGTRFGEVAEDYDDVRPGYAPGLAEAIAAYHGRPPGHVLEIGAGTGKGTEVLRNLGGALTCVEPDERMAAVLCARFLEVTVLVAPFESAFESAGAGPADVVGCAMAWHWLDPARRNRLAFDALRPGGTLAVFGHRYAYADPAHARAFDAAFAAVDPTPPVVRHDDWAFDDIRSSGLFADARLVRTDRPLPMSAERYLRLVRTFGPFRAKDAAGQARTLEVLAATLDDLGGATVLDLRTTLALARRA